MRHPMTCRLSGALLGALAMASLQGCKRADTAAESPPADPSPIAYLQDSVLTLRVRTALIRSPVMNGLDIGVETHEGVVLLSGRAPDPTQIDLAVFVAENVPGVGSVNSTLYACGTPATHPVRQGYSPDLAALRARRVGRPPAVQ